MLLKKTGWIWSILLLLIVVAVLMSLAIGRYPLSLASVLRVIFNPMEEDIANNIVLSVRLPRVLLALMVGAGLAISGACFQGVFQNPLVSPDVLSTSSGAAFGAVLGIMTLNTVWSNTLFALVFGCISVFLRIPWLAFAGKSRH